MVNSSFSATIRSQFGFAVNGKDVVVIDGAEYFGVASGAGVNRVLNGAIN